jgi:polysaccharide pyruvyl transferase WcaK-like protein
MKKIVLAGLLNIKNFGDGVIADCTEYLYNEETKSIPNVIYSGLDLRGLEQVKRNKSYPLKKLNGIKFRLQNLFYNNSFEIRKREFMDYYEKRIKGSSLIVAVGGGIIKYKYEQFWLYLDALISVAEKHHIPVVLNAVGVESYDENNEKCQILKKALNKTAVKAITTRDDIDTLSRKYLDGNKNIFCQKVADSAVWASTVYDVDKDKNSDIVGVGLVRGEIFRDNEIPLSRNQVIETYVGIFSELEKRNIKWKAFTNGLPKDLELADEIFKQIGKPTETKNILTPKKSKDLIEIVSGFKGVIAARLHANIISYSLQIPSIGLVWNNKLPMFGKTIGYPERFINYKKFNRTYIINHLEKAIKEGFDSEEMLIYKMTAKNSINNILNLTN